MDKYQKMAVTVVAAAAMMWTAACQNSQVANGPANAPANKPAANVPNTANTAAAVNSAPADLSSPTAAYKSAYTARKNCDMPALKRVLSKDVLDFMTEIGKADEKDKKTLDEMLTEMCKQPQAPTAEARNEKINGDKATIEYLDETGSWHSMDLVKDNGEWRITIGDADKPPVDDTKGSSKSKDKK